MPPRLSLVLALAALSLPAAAHATVYKCLLDDGRVFYQDAPCAPGRELRDFDREPANVSVVPFTPPEKATPPAKPSGAKSEKRADKAAAREPKTARAGDAAERKFLRPGMSEAEVLARVGPPDMTGTKNRKSQRWTYMPNGADPHTITNLLFDHGKLVDVERKVIR
ncbi:MAG TPA: DUF4124 domain-containing protein [Casimicrobiaceae bacterium]|jgi:hypothetical protein